jgi:outer membrane protein assembly factor BamA
LEYPNFFKNVRFKITISEEKRPRMIYTGVGNYTHFYKDSREFFEYGQHRWGFNAIFKIKAYKKHSILTGIQVDRFRKFDEKTLFRMATLEGKEGGYSNSLLIGYIYDKRDNEFFPTKGRKEYIAANIYSDIFGSNYSFLRLTFADLRFFRLKRKSKRYVLGNRLLVDWMFKGPPYYELGYIFYEDRYYSLGGESSLRGYPPARYVDKIKLSNQLEFRLYLTRFRIFSQNFKCYFISFIDIGRVWDKMVLAPFDGFRVSGGGGPRLSWNDRFIIRLDFAKSLEMWKVHLGFGNTF